MSRQIRIPDATHDLLVAAAQRNRRSLAMEAAHRIESHDREPVSHVQLAREGGEDSEAAEVVVLIKRGAEGWEEVIRERLSGSFSTIARAPERK